MKETARLILLFVLCIFSAEDQAEITTHPQKNVKTIEGGNITLSCNATGNLEPTISWTKDGSLISSNSRISLSDNNKQLTITNVSRTDSGEYRCVANNSQGNDTSNSTALDVKFAPEISKHPKNTNIVEGGDVAFSCSVVGKPTPSVNWTKNGEELNVTANHRLSLSSANNNHSLKITDVKRSDTGQYRCVAINSISSSTSSAATLTVQYPPKNVTVVSKGSRVVTISWTAGFDGNMAIQNYTVEISEDNQTFRDAMCQGSLSPSACVVSSKSASLTGLFPWTTYYIKVHVFVRNVVGSSGGSSIVKVTTDEEVPSRAPVLMDPVPLNSTSILVEWEPLDNRYVHGILTKYVIRYSDDKKTSEKTVARSRLEAVVNGLRQSTTYSFRVLAATVKGNGPQSEPKSATTKDPPIPPTPAPSDIGTTEVSVSFVVRQTLSNGKPVRYYQIIVLPLGKEKEPGKSSDKNYINITRTYEDRVEGQPYITAEFANDDKQRTTFPVGDGKYYSRSGVTEARRKHREEFIKYLNGKLDEGKRYAVFQRSFGEDGDYQNEGFTRFKTIEDDKSVKGSTDKDDKDNTMTIAVVVPIVVVVVLGAGVFFCRRRNNSANDEEDQEIGAYDNHDVEGEIPVEEFEERVRRLHTNNTRIFSREYDALRPRAEFTCNASWAQENKHKNRYDNIVAYDHSRVKLTPVKGAPGSDYINANFLDGYQKKKAYIATQGPLEHTIGDFWRMVWEQGTKTIVMVANLGEKCHQYWPSEGAKSYGDIQVTLMQTVEHSEFTIRTMTLKKSNNSEQRKVHQYHYTTWPDHGVNPSSLLAFIRKASGANPPDAGPMVVHCSAGVGRTATFIAIDAMLRRMAAEKTVDVFGYVMSLRRDRNFMVQNEEQYVLIHDVLVEAIHSGLTETRASDFRSHINGENQASGQSEMDEEFIPFQAANIVQDKIRNSYPNALPFDNTREVEGSEYMSADVIRGDMTRRAFIATQE